MDDKFWLNEPTILYKDMDLVPKRCLTTNKNLNILTRLLLLITLGMFLLGYDNYIMIFVIGMITIFILNSYSKKEDFIGELKPNRKENCGIDENKDLINMAYEVTTPIHFNHHDDSKRSYMNAKYELTPLAEAEGFTQIWRNEPEMCGEYTMLPEEVTEFPIENVESVGQCNYITRSKVDHLSLFNNNLISTRPIVEQTFNQSMIDFRDSIKNEHLDRFRRERQHNCSDMKLSTASAGSGGSI